MRPTWGWLYLYRRLGLIGIGARGSQDAPSRTSFTLVAKPHASVLGFLHHHQFGFIQNTLQHLCVNLVPTTAPRGQQRRGASATKWRTRRSRRHLSGRADSLPLCLWEGAGWLCGGNKNPLSFPLFHNEDKLIKRVYSLATRHRLRRKVNVTQKAYNSWQMYYTKAEAKVSTIRNTCTTHKSVWDSLPSSLLWVFSLIQQKLSLNWMFSDSGRNCNFWICIFILNDHVTFWLLAP